MKTLISIMAGIVTHILLFTSVAERTTCALFMGWWRAGQNRPRQDHGNQSRDRNCDHDESDQSLPGASAPLGPSEP
jgi:hypothetical protein